MCILMPSLTLMGPWLLFGLKLLKSSPVLLLNLWRWLFLLQRQLIPIVFAIYYNENFKSIAYCNEVTIAII